MIDIFLFPFIASLVFALIHSFFGVHILSRGIIFADLSIAQFSALGVVLSLIFGTPKYLTSFLFSVLSSVFISLLRREKVEIKEAFIGVLYIFGFNLTIIFLSYVGGYEELRKIFSGNILYITRKDIFEIFSLYIPVGIVLLIFNRRFYVSHFLYDVLFFGLLGIVVSSSVPKGGVIFVFSLLIVPPLFASLFTQDITKKLFISWGLSFASIIFSFLLSLKFDIPTGPLISLFLSAITILFFLVRYFIHF